MTEPKRLRMFAGPNGSGKTTLVRNLSKDFSSNGHFRLHHYINADDLLREFQNDRGVSIASFGLETTTEDIRHAISMGRRIAPDHPFLSAMQVADGILIAPATSCDSYASAVVADFLRERLLSAGESFSFETVMSHRSKVEFFDRARRSEYQTYLYFIATDAASLNALRVEHRVDLGGHRVPIDKIRDRYERTLSLAGAALSAAHRAFFFDNSGKEPVLIAEKTPDLMLDIKVSKSSLPRWFTSYVLPG